MTETTTPTPPTPAQRAEALAQYQTLEAQLLERFRGTDQAPEGSPKRAHLDKMLVVAKIAHAPEPAVTTPGPSWQERRDHRETQRVLRAELCAHTVPGTTEAQTVIDDIVDAQMAFDQKRAPAPTPGEVTWTDVKATPSLSTWLPADRDQFVQRMQTLGGVVTPIEATLVGAEIQSVRELNRQTPPELREVATYDETTRFAAERALARLFPDAAYRESLAEDGLWHVGAERLVAALVELDRRAKR